MLRYANLYKDKTEYELDYWIKNGIRIGTKKYVEYLSAFGLKPADLAAASYLDVGAGPFGGIAAVAPTSEKAVVADPLYPVYQKRNLCYVPAGVEILDLPAEKLHTVKLPLFDYVFSCNALDHSPWEQTDESDVALVNMRKLLKPGGRLCIYVHLRTADQLDYGHDFSVTPERLQAAVVKGFQTEKWATMSGDPINRGKCRTAILVIRREE